jgi:hypothetical protein
MARPSSSGTARKRAPWWSTRITSSRTNSPPRPEREVRGERGVVPAERPHVQLALSPQVVDLTWRSPDRPAEAVAFPALQHCREAGDRGLDARDMSPSPPHPNTHGTACARSPIGSPNRPIAQSAANRPFAKLPSRPLAAVLPEADDLPFLEMAASGDAILVTGNPRHFPKAATGTVRVLRPGECLEVCREQP